MVSIWGHGLSGRLGGSLAPGLGCWAAPSAARTRAAGRAVKDLAACNAYGDGLAAAADGDASRRLVVLGERDLMTPAQTRHELAAALTKARVVTLKGAGHMLMSERPDEVLAAVAGFRPRAHGASRRALIIPALAIALTARHGAAMDDRTASTCRQPRDHDLGTVRHDWTREELRALFALPFPELIFRAQSVHRLESVTPRPRGAHFHAALDQDRRLSRGLRLLPPERRATTPG